MIGNVRVCIGGVSWTMLTFPGRHFDESEGSGRVVHSACGHRSRSEMADLGRRVDGGGCDPRLESGGCAQNLGRDDYGMMRGTVIGGDNHGIRCICA